MSFPSWICVYLHAISIGGIEGSPSHNKRLHVCTTFKEKEKKRISKTLRGYLTTKNHVMFPKNPWRVFYIKTQKDFKSHYLKK